jgi:RNA polymerase sigma-70 factor (ECF subfamily)
MTDESELYDIIQEFRPMAEKAAGRLSCDADDILHDAYVAWVSYLRKFPEMSNPHGFAFVLVRNVITNRSRRRIIETKYDESYQRERLTPIEEVPSPEDDYLGLELSEEMSNALDSINEDQAHTLWLHHVADVSVADIALLTGVKVGTVLSRLHRGREGLKRKLKKGVN